LLPRPIFCTFQENLRVLKCGLLFDGLNRKHRLQQFLYCCVRIRCHGNVF
jgi:hypothetical protein